MRAVNHLFYVALCIVLTGCSVTIPDVEVAEDDPGLFRDRGGHLYYEDELFSGYLVGFYPGGDLKSKVPFFEGLQESVSLGYYASGELMYERRYANGEKHGRHVGYYPSGSMRFLYYFDHGLSTGNHKEWYEDGQLALDLNYKDGHPFGSQKMWRPDGKVRSNYVIREDGRRYGLVGMKRCKNIDTGDERIEPLTSVIYAE